MRSSGTVLPDAERNLVESQSLWRTIGARQPHISGRHLFLRSDRPQSVPEQPTVPHHRPRRVSAAFVRRIPLVSGWAHHWQLRAAHLQAGPDAGAVFGRQHFDDDSDDERMGLAFRGRPVFELFLHVHQLSDHFLAGHSRTGRKDQTRLLVHCSIHRRRRHHAVSDGLAGGQLGHAHWLPHAAGLFHLHRLYGCTWQKLEARDAVPCSSTFDSYGHRLLFPEHAP